MEEKSKGIDLLKVGVLMIGIAAIVIAGIAVHMYYKMLTLSDYYPSPQPGFYASCASDKTIIVSAQRDLSDVKVADKDGNIICAFSAIKGWSDELCNVKQLGTYIISTENEKKFTVCENPPALPGPYVESVGLPAD